MPLTEIMMRIAPCTCVTQQHYREKLWWVKIKYDLPLLTLRYLATAQIHKCNNPALLVDLKG